MFWQCSRINFMIVIICFHLLHTFTAYLTQRIYNALLKECIHDSDSCCMRLYFNWFCRCTVLDIHGMLSRQTSNFNYQINNWLNETKWNERSVPPIWQIWAHQYSRLPGMVLFIDSRNINQLFNLLSFVNVFCYIRFFKNLNKWRISNDRIGNKTCVITLCVCGCGCYTNNWTKFIDIFSNGHH